MRRLRKKLLVRSQWNRQAELRWERSAAGSRWAACTEPLETGVAAAAAAAADPGDVGLAPWLRDYCLRGVPGKESSSVGPLTHPTKREVAVFRSILIDREKTEENTKGEKNLRRMVT